ncbi:hypothetical protein ACP4OV_008752 [Aristida adscensionis]
MESRHPKLQPTTTACLSPSSPPPTHPPMPTAADLEAAIAGLHAKKQRLRETFHRLVACSPVPIAFRWEDLDAHLSSLQSSIALQLRQLQLRAASAANGPTTAVEQPEEDPESSVRRGARRMEEHGSSADEREEREVGPSSDREGEEEGVDDEDAFPLELSASPRQGEAETSTAEEDEASVNPSAEQEASEDELDEARRPRPAGATGGGGGESASALARAIAAGCAAMDASALVDALRLNGRSRFRARRAFLPALLGAADPHGLVLRAVGGFLAAAEPKTDRSWANCVALLDCVPHLATPPAGTLEQAERLARAWKEMVARPGAGSCSDMGRLAGWGLFTFLVSYGVVLEFDAGEIIRLFGDLPRNETNACVELCKRLGLIEKMADSISHLIEDGRPHDAVRLAHALDLTHKYSPICIMYEFLEKAKMTAQEIPNKESDSLESLNQAVAKKINALILSWTAVDECNIDSNHRDSIKAEITQLLHIYADKQRSLAGVSACSSDSHQLQNTQPEKQQQQQQPQPQQQGCGRANFMARQRNKNRKRDLRMKRQRNPQEQQQQKYNKRPRFSSYSGIRGVPFADRISPRQDFDPCDHPRPRPASIPPPKPE